MATYPITKRGAEMLKAELHKLKTVDRPSVIQAIAEARAQGDLSENADYDAAKERQGFIEGRIQEVEGKLSAAQVIDPSTIQADGRVVFGATVELEDEDSGQQVKYQIVGEDEADLKQGLINISSPIARALIGKEVGDTAVVQAPEASAPTKWSPSITSNASTPGLVGGSVGHEPDDAGFYGGSHVVCAPAYPGHGRPDGGQTLRCPDLEFSGLRCHAPDSFQVKSPVGARGICAGSYTFCSGWSVASLVGRAGSGTPHHCPRKFGLVAPLG